MQDNILDQDIVYALASTAGGQTYLAAQQSGLYRSDDSGESWQPVKVSPENERPPAVMAVTTAQGPADVQQILTGVVGGLFVSKDGGTDWTPVALATPPPFVTALAVSPDYASDGIAFAATMEDGVFRSDSHCESWQHWGFGLFDLNVLGLAVSPNFTQDQLVFACTESGLYHSRTAGRSWQVSSFPAEAAPVLCLAISPDFAQDGTLYAGTETAGLYHSDDRGRSWQPLAQIGDAKPINAIVLGTQYPDKPDMLVMTNETLWHSDDAGRTWTPWQEDLDFDDGLTAVLAPQGYSAGNPLLIGLADGRIVPVS